MRALDINFESARVASPDTVSRFLPAGKRALERVFEVMRAVAWGELGNGPARPRPSSARAPLAACSSRRRAGPDRLVMGTC